MKYVFLVNGSARRQRRHGNAALVLTELGLRNGSIRLNGAQFENISIVGESDFAVLIHALAGDDAGDAMDVNSYRTVFAPLRHFFVEQNNRWNTRVLLAGSFFYVGDTVVTETFFEESSARRASDKPTSANLLTQ